jgi:hypothetical protein
VSVTATSLERERTSLPLPLHINARIRYCTCSLIRGSACCSVLAFRKRRWAASRPMTACNRQPAGEVQEEGQGREREGERESERERRAWREEGRNEPRNEEGGARKAEWKVGVECSAIES